MGKTLAILFLVCGLVVPAQAQEWRTELAADQVEIRGEKMVLEEFGLMKFELQGYEPTQWQVRVYSEAPVDGSISRDSFVGMSTMMYLVLLQSITAQYVDAGAGEFLEGWDFTELSEPIGTPDFELAFYMTELGMQIEVTDNSTGQASRQTMTWEDVFRE